MSSGEAASGSQIKEEYNAQEETDHSSRRSTRIRRQFDPNHMPSGTLEMQRLTKQIENDSTSSDDDEQDVDTDIPNALENPNQCPTQQTEENNLGLCMAMTTTEEAPRSWKQAIHIRHWKNAMEKEIEQLEAKNAWMLVDRTDNMKVLPGVWNFRTKKDENGDIVKHKARWCINGSRDKFSWPPETIYSPVAELSTVRLVFAVAATHGQEVRVSV